MNLLSKTKKKKNKTKKNDEFNGLHYQLNPVIPSDLQSGNNLEE